MSQETHPQDVTDHHLTAVTAVAPQVAMAHSAATAADAVVTNPHEERDMTSSWTHHPSPLRMPHVEDKAASAIKGDDATAQGVAITLDMNPVVEGVSLDVDLNPYKYAMNVTNAPATTATATGGDFVSPDGFSTTTEPPSASTSMQAHGDTSASSLSNNINVPLTVADPMGIGLLSTTSVPLPLDPLTASPSPPSTRSNTRHSQLQVPQQSIHTVPSHPSSKPRRDFAYRLAELRNYKLMHGNCMVPHKYKPNPSLGTWVDTQRRRYRSFLRTPSKSTLTQSHVNQLLEVGFVFEPRKTRNETWNARIAQLTEFKNRNGHSHVREDDSTHAGLGKWVSYVRRQYRLQGAGKRSGKRLTEERIQQLKALGFVFEWKEAQALQRFQEGIVGLRAYWSQEGHVHVPKFYPTNPTFGLCVEDMRMEYRLICKRLMERHELIKEVREQGGHSSSLPYPLVQGTGSYLLSQDLVQELASMGFLQEEGLNPMFDETSSSSTTTGVTGGAENPMGTISSAEEPFYFDP